MPINVLQITNVETPTRIQIENYLISRGWVFRPDESTNTPSKLEKTFRRLYFDTFDGIIRFHIDLIAIYIRGYDYHKTWDDQAEKLVKEIAKWEKKPTYEVYQSIIQPMSSQLRDYRHYRYIGIPPVGVRKYFDSYEQSDLDILKNYLLRAVKARNAWLDSLK